MAEHTPGPWKVYDPHDSPCMSYCSPNGCSESHPSGMRCVEGPPVLDEIRFENVADAHLVAAAPDLLLTLKEIERELSEGRTTDLLERIAAGGSDTAWVARLALKARVALAIATTT